MSQDKHNEPGSEPEFSLEEILAEFSSKRPPQKAVPVEPEQPAGGSQGPEEPPSPQPQPPRRGGRRGKVISFPGGLAGHSGPGEPEARPEQPETDPVEQAGPQPSSLPEEDKLRSPHPPRSAGADPEEEHRVEEEPEPDEAGPEGGQPPEEGDEEPDNVVAFPRRRAWLEELLARLSGKMDRYADQMYEDEGVEISEATRRAEELIPGVDDEEQPPPPPRRPRRRVQPPPPDLSPQELFQRYSKGLISLRRRSRLLLLPCLAQL